VRANSYAYTYPDGNANGHSDGYTYSHANRYAQSHTQATSDSAPSPDAAALAA
jgi:hypothetical protein